VRIGSATTGTAPLESIPLALIDRVEVLPGPASSLYGADAIGGVIQIFTKSAERSPGAVVSVTRGANGLNQWVAGYAAKLGTGTSLSLGLDNLRSDGFSATNASNLYSYDPDRDGLLQRGAHVTLTHQLNEDHQVGVNWLRSASKVHYDDGSGLDSFSNTVTQTLAAHWKGRVSEAMDSEVRVARAQDESEDHSGFPGSFTTHQTQLSWLNHVAVAGGTATAGLEWLKQEVDSTTLYTTTERTVRSGLLGWRGAWGAHALQVDLRGDRNSQFGQHGTGQIGWAWRLDDAWRVRASAGTAFHAPSFNLLYYPGFGVATLKPERSGSFELGTDGRLSGLDLSAILFDNHIRDLIDYAPPSYDPANVAKARIKGLTLTAAGAIARDTRLKFNLTAQSPENQDTNAPLRRRSRLFGGAHLSHNEGALQLGTDLTWVGKRYDGADRADPMGAYGLVALFAGWTFNPAWRLEGRVNNAGDKRYTTALGYNAPGREGQVTLRWTPAL